jgi:hypothetical protein
MRPTFRLTGAPPFKGWRFYLPVVLLADSRRVLPQSGHGSMLPSLRGLLAPAALLRRHGSRRGARRFAAVPNVRYDVEAEDHDAYGILVGGTATRILNNDNVLRDPSWAVGLCLS